MTAVPDVRPVSIDLWMLRLKVLRLEHAWPDPTRYQQDLIDLAKERVALVEQHDRDQRRAAP